MVEVHETRVPVKKSFPLMFALISEVQVLFLALGNLNLVTRYLACHAYEI
jgi:hypothetical protein